MIIKNDNFNKQIEELDRFITSLGKKEGILIAVLHKAQGLIGYLPREIQIWIADRLSIPIAQVYGVVTFYSYFKTKPIGKYHIDVCLGTACYVTGSEEVLEKLKKTLNLNVGDSTPDGLFSLNNVRCIGACGLAPAVAINGKVYGKVTVEDIDKILEQYREEAKQ